MYWVMECVIHVSPVVFSIVYLQWEIANHLKED